MTLYAYYDPKSSAPQQVKGWCNTELHRYPDLPPVTKTVPKGYIEVSQDIWNQHLTDLSHSSWTVVDGVVTYNIVSTTKKLKVVVPESITMHQLQHVLYDTPSKKQLANMFEEVNAFIETTDFKTKLAWEKAATVSRIGDLIKKIAAQFSLTDKQVDQMFIAASQITA